MIDFFFFFFPVHSLETHFLDWSKDILHHILRQRTLDVKKEVHLRIGNLGQFLVFLCVLWLLSRNEETATRVHKDKSQAKKKSFKKNRRS